MTQRLHHSSEHALSPAQGLRSPTLPALHGHMFPVLLPPRRRQCHKPAGRGQGPVFISRGAQQWEGLQRTAGNRKSGLGAPTQEGRMAILWIVLLYGVRGQDRGVRAEAWAPGPCYLSVQPNRASRCQGELCRTWDLPCREAGRINSGYGHSWVQEAVLSNWGGREYCLPQETSSMKKVVSHLLF